MSELKKQLENNFTYKNEIFIQDNTVGYWSNFSNEDQRILFEGLKNSSLEDVIREHFPQFSEMIFSNSRAAGLELLDIKKDEIGIDYGCMWGNLLIHSSKMCKEMLGIDQTMDSLKVLKNRINKEKIDNIHLLNANLRNEINLNNQFDFAIVNGVLEWVPETREVIVKDYYKQKGVNVDSENKNPRQHQLKFLKQVAGHLTTDGRLYLAIENRYDYQHFLWKRDIHPNLMYTAFLPRSISNIISQIFRKRPYTNYIYSSKELKKLLKLAGFKTADVYAVFPDYRFPQKIIELGTKDTSHYEPVYAKMRRDDLIAKVFRKIRYALDILIYKKLKLFSLAPSFIVIAKK